MRRREHGHRQFLDEVMATNKDISLVVRLEYRALCALFLQTR